MLQGRITQDEYYAWQIAHSDIIGTDEMLTGYELPLEQQKELEVLMRKATRQLYIYLCPLDNDKETT